MSMEQIEQRTRALSEARDRLSEAVQALQDGVNALHRKHLPQLKRHMRRAFDAEQQLRALVEEHPALFTKPRTVVFHGIKVGYEKGKGAITFDDADLVVKLIEKKLPDQADVLIDTVKKPVKKALAQLSVDQLRKLGCEVDEAGDHVVIRPVDSAVDKLLKALLKGMSDELEAVAEASD